MKNPLFAGIAGVALTIEFGTLVESARNHREPIVSVASVTASPTPMVTPTPKSDQHKIGDVVKTGDLAIQVTKVNQMDRLAPKNPFAPPIIGKIIVVPFVVTNTSNRTGNIFFNEFLLTDGQQRQYSEIDDLSYSLWRSEVRVKPRSEGLYPGEHRVDVAAFIVAPDANTFSLQWKDQIISLTNKQQLKQQQSRQLTPSNTPTSEESHITTKVVNAKDGYANLRSQPSTEVSVVRTLQNGTQVKILDNQTNGDGQLWYKVQAEEQMGWIFSDLLN
jgi:hypothetical protein